MQATNAHIIPTDSAERVQNYFDIVGKRLREHPLLDAGVFDVDSRLSASEQTSLIAQLRARYGGTIAIATRDVHGGSGVTYRTLQIRLANP